MLLFQVLKMGVCSIASEGHLAEDSRNNRWPAPVAMCALAYLVCTVFFPMVGFEFVESDVFVQVVQNPDVQGLSWKNVKHILTSRCFTSYYPVRTLTYALDYQIWGLNAGGFKLTNGLIHLGNVYLVFWLILRLLRRWDSPGGSPKTRWDVFVATLPAALFAVHPVVVEPVVWEPGREELLMTLGILGCLHFHLSAHQSRQEDRARRRVPLYYFASLLCAAIACLSNAVAAVIPLLVIACSALMPMRPKLWQIARDTGPLWILSVVTIAIKISGDQAVLRNSPEMLPAQRLFLVLNVYWANVTTLVRPTKLCISYNVLNPRSLFQLEVVLGAIAIGMTCAALWACGRRRVALFGLLWFGIALGPASQIMPHHVHRADRFLYLPLVGLAIAAGGCLRALADVRSGRAARTRWMAVGTAGLLLLYLLVTLSARQVQTWRNSLTVWEHCVKVAPDNPISHRVFADSLAKSGQLEPAFAEYEIALQLAPDYIHTLKNFAYYLTGRQDARAIELAERGCKLTGWQDPGMLRTLARACASQATALWQDGKEREALDFYNRAIEIDPSDDIAWIQLAHFRATCADQQLRDATQALQLAERASQLNSAANPVKLAALADVYAAIGQFDKAARAIAQARQLAESSGSQELVEELEYRLTLYRDRVSRPAQP